MNKARLAALPAVLAATLGLAACGGAEPAAEGSAPPSSSSASTAAPVASPSPDNESVSPSGAADGISRYTDAELKDVVSGYFGDQEGLTVIGGEDVKSAAGAAGEALGQTKVEPQECNVLTGMDLEAELDKASLAVGVLMNPEDPSQSVSLSVASYKDAAAAEQKFVDGGALMEKCAEMTVETMGVKASVKSEPVDLDVEAQNATVVRMTTEAAGTTTDGFTVVLLEDGLQVQFQLQGADAEAAEIAEAADDAQALLEELKRG
jgi:hypothetical protein